MTSVGASVKKILRNCDVRERGSPRWARACVRHWRARLCAGARARTRHRIFLRDTRIDARRSATDIPTNAHTPTRPFSLPILSPSIPFASLSPSLSLCIPTFLRSRVSRVHRGIVRTYVRTKRGREGKSQREREDSRSKARSGNACARVS